MLVWEGGTSSVKKNIVVKISLRPLETCTGFWKSSMVMGQDRSAPGALAFGVGGGLAAGLAGAFLFRPALARASTDLFRPPLDMMDKLPSSCDHQVLRDAVVERGS